MEGNNTIFDFAKLEGFDAFALAHSSLLRLLEKCC